MHKHFILSLFLLVGGNLCAQYRVLELLEGNWENIKDSNKLEIWEKNGLNLTGRSLTIEEGQEKVWEQLKIYNKAGVLTYEADVEGNEAAVLFQMSFISENEVIFSNEQHDFPKHIHYRFINKDRLRVEVYAVKGGKSLLFEFVRRET